MSGSTPAPESKPVTSTKININDVVEIINDAKYYNGKAVPDWVKKKKWVVKSVSGDRAVIDKSADGHNSINSPINVKYLSTVKTEFKPYIVRVNVDALNIRKGPSTNYAIVGVIRDKGAYTIIEENGTWGKLKSGAGWISLNYCTKK
jgi:SH3-like domain-containing protein